MLANQAFGISYVVTVVTFRARVSSKLLWVTMGGVTRVTCESWKGESMACFYGAGKVVTARGHGLRWEESGPG